MLDERGVEYVAIGGMTEWTNENRLICRAYTRPEPQIVDVAMLAAPPQQAIDATLGSGTCKLDGFADAPFSVDYEIEGYDMDSGRDYATLAECSACGAYVIVPPEYHHVLTCDGDEVYQPYRFCPNCGAKVVDA